MRIVELRCKDVINICTCQSLGCPADIEFDPCTGCLTALIVPGPGRCFGFLGREQDIIIPWNCIRQIGEDIILVELPAHHPKNCC